MLSIFVQVIEELAEWIDHAFCKYPATIGDARGAERNAVQTHLAPKSHESGSSPLTSETETDDTCITFVPKRHHEMGGAVGSGKEEVEEESETTAKTAEKQTTPRQTGEKITESELMRRRRLLDSHIFD